MPRVSLTQQEIKFLTDLLEWKIEEEGPDTDGYISSTPEPESAILDVTKYDVLQSKLLRYLEYD